MEVQFHHLKGMEGNGYTVGVKLRKDGQYAASIVQLRKGADYDEQLAERVALARLKRGMYFVHDSAGIAQTLETLRSKLDTDPGECQQ